LINSNFRHWLAWGVIMVLATVISLMSLRFLMPDPPHVGPEIMANFKAHRPAFLAHVTGGLVALLLGPWQFVAKLRARFPKAHRWSGRVYLLAVLIGGIGGFLVAWTTVSGLMVSFGFSFLAVFWLYSSWRAYQSARAGEFTAHRRWMIRSFALTCAAITLRLGLPIAPALGYEFQTGYVILSWACWIINVAMAETYLRFVPTPTSRA
jgi:uncharacterized membrane protein